MKQKRILLAILVIAVVFTLTSCRSEGDTAHTVTFDADNGTAVTTQTVTHGATAAEPAPPVKTGYKCIFAGWYDESRTTPFVFSAPVTADITLYAQWRPYELGESAPGGGKIFYRAEPGFTQYQHADDDIGTTCHYLEAAPEDMETRLAMAEGDFSPSVYLLSWPWNTTGLGMGRKNTALIISTSSSTPAAQACNGYNHGGKTDWFLSSKDELYQLYINRDHVDNLKNDTYCSSSSNRTHADIALWVLYGSSGTMDDGEFRGRLYWVRAIRAF